MPETAAPRISIPPADPPKASGIDFYAPLKAPTHPNPSGDRAMARALFALLSRDTFVARFGQTSLVSEFRSLEPKGDPDSQKRMTAEAAIERRRVTQLRPPALFFTYHNYYKAPDFLGPAAADRHALYAIVEPSRSAKRANGPWASFAAAADAATARADVLFHMTERDRPALAEALRPGQTLAHLRPFLAELGAEPEDRPVVEAGAPLHVLTVAMMRRGDKAASYGALFRALAEMRAPWRLSVAGDGPARAAIAADADQVLGPSADIVFLGRLDGAALRAAYAAADVFAWPGVNEAYGLVYLEAQAAGAAVVAEDRPGVRDVARNGALLTPPNDPGAFARALDCLARDVGRRRAIGAAGRAQMIADHSADAAASTLFEALAEADERRRRAA